MPAQPQTIASLITLGIHRIMGMTLKDQMDPRWIWTAVKGGWKYVIAMRDGDQTDAQTVAARLNICSQCSAFEQSATRKEGLEAAYCGRGYPINDQPTCGCLVAITINGQTEAAGKLFVASEECPRGHWSSSGRI